MSYAAKQRSDASKEPTPVLAADRNAGQAVVALGTGGSSTAGEARGAIGPVEPGQTPLPRPALRENRTAVSTDQQSLRPQSLTESKHFSQHEKYSRYIAEQRVGGCWLETIYKPSMATLLRH